jgi:hypothetical protein
MAKTGHFYFDYLYERLAKQNFVANPGLPQNAYLRCPNAHTFRR